MTEVQLSVTKMTCAKCAQRVEQAIQAVSGVQGVQVELSTGIAKVKINSQDVQTALTDALEEAGYPSVITQIST